LTIKDIGGSFAGHVSREWLKQFEQRLERSTMECFDVARFELDRRIAKASVLLFGMFGRRLPTGDSNA
jgi:hypothetical protein